MNITRSNSPAVAAPPRRAVAPQHDDASSVTASPADAAGRTGYHLSKSELAILRAIDAAPGKVLEWSECRKAAGLTIRGSRTVMNRMQDASLIAPSDSPATYRWPTLTFKGMQALKGAAA